MSPDPGVGFDPADGPDPFRPFWWLTAGDAMPKQAAPGSRLPADADYWSQAGIGGWVRVERSPDGVAFRFLPTPPPGPPPTTIMPWVVPDSAYRSPTEPQPAKVAA